MPTLVNHIDKWGYIHIPKTGGSSIGHQLDNLPNIVTVSIGHPSIRDFGNIDNYFIFCFVRNPFYQIISGYLHMKRDLHSHYKSIASGAPAETNINYKFYGFNTPNIPLTFLEYVKLIEASKIYMYNTQSWQIYDGETPEKKVSFIGRYENYDKDVRFIFDKININYIPYNVNKNDITSKYVTREEYYKQQYTEQWMIDWVLDRYKEDFENFGYDKKL